MKRVTSLSAIRRAVAGWVARYATYALPRAYPPACVVLAELKPRTETAPV